eukprot:766662-Hanusia_phi.AAC.4
MVDTWQPSALAIWMPTEPQPPLPPMMSTRSPCATFPQSRRHWREVPAATPSMAASMCMISNQSFNGNKQCVESSGGSRRARGRLAGHNDPAAPESLLGPGMIPKSSRALSD